MRSTLQGHGAAQASESDAACVLVTTSARYELDEDGMCRAVSPLDGVITKGAERCIGAQYVACLHGSADGLLAGEPLCGGYALFIGRGTGSRMALLKTQRIKAEQWPEDEVARPSQMPPQLKSTMQWPIAVANAEIQQLIPALPVPKLD